MPVAELDRLRRRIDALDRKLVSLLNERAELAIRVGEAKAAGGRPAIRDLNRERDVLGKVVASNEGPLTPEELASVYRRVFAATRRLQSERARDAQTQLEQRPE